MLFKATQSDATQSGGSPSRILKSTWLASAILLLSLVPSAQLAWNSRDMPHLALDDDGIYLVCAKSLAEGTGYRILSLPQEPFQTKYPPLYPWLLSFLWRINPSFPSNLTMAAFFAWALLPTSTALAWWLYTEMGLGLVQRSILCAVMALSPYMAFLSIHLYSDLCFCCFLYIALILAERATKPESAVFMAFGAGLLAGLAYLTKSAATAFLISAPLCYAARKQYPRALAFVAGMAPFVLLWSLWARLHLSHSDDMVTLYYTNYIGMYFKDLHWADMPLLLSSNVVTLVGGICGLFVYTQSSPVWLTLLSFALAFSCISGTLRLSRRYGVLQYPVFGCLYALTLIAWNFPPTVRFLVPLFPLVVMALGVELDHFRSMIAATLARPGIADRVVAVALSAAVFVFFCFVAMSARTELYEHFPGWVDGYRAMLRESRPAHAWIARNTPPSANFLTSRDAFLYLYTGRHATGQPQPTTLYYRGDVEGLSSPPPSFRASFAREQGLSYYYDEGNDSLQKLIQSGEFKPVYSSSYVSILEILKSHP